MMSFYPIKLTTFLNPEQIEQKLNCEIGGELSPLNWLRLHNSKKWYGKIAHNRFHLRPASKFLRSSVMINIYGEILALPYNSGSSVSIRFKPRLPYVFLALLFCFFAYLDLPEGKFIFFIFIAMFILEFVWNIFRAINLLKSSLNSI